MIPATTSPLTVTAAIVPNSGRPDAKFFVPSTGSTRKARSASARAFRSDGSRSVASSPTTTASGKRARRAAPIRFSAASSASVTRSRTEDLWRTWPSERFLNRGRISAIAASRRIDATARAWTDEKDTGNSKR